MQDVGFASMTILILSTALARPTRDRAGGIADARVIVDARAVADVAATDKRDYNVLGIFILIFGTSFWGLYAGLYLGLWRTCIDSPRAH